jgi:hypothetical protein
VNIFSLCHGTAGLAQVISCTQANNGFAALYVSKGFPNPWVLEFDLDKKMISRMSTPDTGGQLTNTNPISVRVNDDVIEWYFPPKDPDKPYFQLKRDSLDLFYFIKPDTGFRMYNCRLYKKLL